YLHLNFNRHPQKRSGDRCAPGAVFILVVEQCFELALQVSCLAVLFGGFESIHGGAIIVLEPFNELCRCEGPTESIGIAGEGDLLLRNTSATKALRYLVFHTP